MSSARCRAALIAPSTHGDAMSSIKGFLCGLAAGTGLAAFAMQYHVVRSSEGVLVVPRTEKAPVRSTYVDVREWSLSMWQQYPEVSAALTRTGRADLITKGVADGMAEQFGMPRGTTDAPTAQRAESLVPIRFLDPQSGAPAHKPNAPAAKAPAAVPWEDFLKGSTQGVDVRTVPDPAFPEQAAVPPTAPTATNAPPITYRPLTASRSTESETEVIPDLFRQVVNVRKPGSTLTQSLADAIELQTDDVANYVFSEVDSGEPPVPITPLDPTSEAPKREWVRGLLQSLIPKSTAPPEAVPNRETTGVFAPLLDAPAPGHFNDNIPLTYTYPNTVAPPARAIRPF